MSKGATNNGTGSYAIREASSVAPEYVRARGRVRSLRHSGQKEYIRISLMIVDRVQLPVLV